MNRISVVTSIMKISCFLVLLISRVRSQEVSTRSSLLRPRNYNHHAFDADQFSKSLKAEPTKQGPVLFPNDGPPPPRPPLIVTSRPLIESIARSELGQPNNTEASQSQVNGRVSFLPYLARVNDYRPYSSPNFNYDFVPSQIPYANVVKKSRIAALQPDYRYNDYEEQTVLPPIYKALSEHATQKVLKLNDKHLNYNYEEQTVLPPIYKALSEHATQKVLKLNDKHLNYNYEAPQSDFARNYQNNDINENSEYDQNQNYAFSYRVNDIKTGDDFSHSQQSSGSATNGEYRVRLPDGRMQIVSYTADENGYKADVRYDDEEKTGANRIDNQNYQNIYNDYAPNDYNVDKNIYGTAGRNINNAYEDRNKNVYVERNQNNNVYDRNNPNNVDYTDRSIKNDYNNAEKKEKPVTERDDYYHYPDVSKEYYNDYSSEYNNNYEPHRSKFSTYGNNENVITNKAAVTVKPSYEELKDLFVAKGIYNTQQNYESGDISVSSTTPVPFDGTTEHVVVIGTKTPNLYTNIKSSLTNEIPSYASPRVVIATTPSSYLVSTIASLKNKVHLASKPILSDRFIDKINKYLSFN